MATTEEEMEIAVTSEEPDDAVDELKELFDLLEEREALEDAHGYSQPHPEDYQALLANPRLDDTAVKIKELCIYRCFNLYYFSVFLYVR